MSKLWGIKKKACSLFCLWILSWQKSIRFNKKDREKAKKSESKTSKELVIKV
jgi:hypothetical protein